MNLTDMWKIVLTVAITLAFALICLVIAVRVVLNRTLKRKMNEMRELNKYAPKDSIVFLGDSLTDFYPVNEFFHFPKIVNRGIANDRTKDVKKRIDEVTDVKPKYVYLQIGINDFIRSFKRMDPIVVAKRIVSVLEMLTDNTDVRLISLYPVNSKKNFLSRFCVFGVNNQKIIRANEYLENYTRIKGITYIDAFPALVDADGRLNKEFTIEGLHLTVKGYEALTSVLMPYVRKDSGYDKNRNL